MGSLKHFVDKDTLGDQQISFFVVFYFFAQIANATIKTVLPIPDGLWNLISIAWGVLIIYYLLRCIKVVWRRSSKIFASSLILFTFIYITSLLLISYRGEPTQGFWKGQVLISYAYWIPVGVAAASINNKQIFYDMFYKWSYLMSILLFACVFFRRSTELMEGELEYNMFFGFHLVIPALFHISQYYKTKNRLILSFFIFEVILLVIYANRGALIPIVFYFIFRILLNDRDNSQKKVANVILLTLISLIIFVFSDAIFVFLEDLSTAMGIRSRTLTLMANGEMTDPTGRDELSAIAWNMIATKPILGWGLGGEFYEISRQLGQMTPGVSSAAFTPHNGILEFLISFGIIGGVIASFFFIKPLFSIGNIKDPNTALLILIFGAAVVAPSMISADGLLIKPGAAVYIYLYYFSNRHRVRSNPANVSV